MEKNKSDDAENAILSLPQPPGKVSCDPILNTSNSNKEMSKLARMGNKSKSVQKR